MANKESKVILAVGAHPDDMDFSASGTIAKFIEEGAKAYYLICTDGSRGSADPKMTHRKLAEIRRKEQQKAGKILGLTDIFFLDHTDTELVADIKLKEQIVRIIRTIKPQIVITFDPTFFYSTQPLFNNRHFINHTDHRAAGLATLDAVFPLSRDRLTFIEHEKIGLKPHRVEELWLTSFDKKHHVVDITKTIEKKLQAIAAHESQFDDFPTIKKRMIERAIKFAEDEKFTFAENFIRLLMP